MSTFKPNTKVRINIDTPTFNSNLHGKIGVVTRRISSDVYAVILDGMDWEKFFSVSELEKANDPGMAWFHEPIHQEPLVRYIDDSVEGVKYPITSQPEKIEEESNG